MKIRALILTIVASVALSAAAQQPPLAAGRALHYGPLEKEFLEIEKEVPGFAGWYFDAEGSAVARIKHADRAADAVARVTRIVEARRAAGRGRAGLDHRTITVQTRPALYSFSELATYRETLWRQLTADVHTVDVDEVNNVVKLGVTDEEGARRVRAAAARLRIPGAALKIEVLPEPRSRGRNLADYNRPLYGGNSHAFRQNNQTKWGTIGVNVAPNGNTANSGFFTASHCTAVPWGADGGTHYQHDYQFYRIATEAADPVPTASLSGCPSGVLCRWSDAAFVRYDDDKRTEADGGSSIAQTTGWGYYTWGSVEINGTMPILGDHTYSPAGDWLDKIGITSGWTYGQVLDTCQHHRSDFRAGGSVVYVLCSDVTDIWSEPGDSGSPVFKWYSNGVNWAGILWGGPGDDYTRSYHSPVWNVRTELPNYTFY